MVGREKSGADPECLLEEVVRALEVAERILRCGEVLLCCKDIEVLGGEESGAGLEHLLEEFARTREVAERVPHRTEALFRCEHTGMIFRKDPRAEAQYDLAEAVRLGQAPELLRQRIELEHESDLGFFTTRLGVHERLDHLAQELARALAVVIRERGADELE